MSFITYWHSKADATSPPAQEQASKLQKQLQSRLVLKQKINQGQVLWHGQTTLGLKIQLRVAPLQVTFCPPFWRRVSDFFTIDKLSSLQNLTMQKLALARQVGAETLGELLNSYVNLDMDVQWAAPKVIVPIDPSRVDRAVAFLDLGQITATSTPMSLADLDKKFDVSGLYEDILMTLENVHLAFLPSKSALQEQLAGAASPPR